MIKNGVSGYLVDVGDIEGAASKALHLLTDESLQRQFAEAALQSIKERFSSNKIIAQYEEIYQQLTDWECDNGGSLLKALPLLRELKNTAGRPTL